MGGKRTWDQDGAHPNRRTDDALIDRRRQRFFEPRGFTLFGEYFQIYIRKNNGGVIRRRYGNLPRLQRNAA
jgi:hypothetical protein